MQFVPPAFLLLISLMAAVFEAQMNAGFQLKPEHLDGNNSYGETGW